VIQVCQICHERQQELHYHLSPRSTDLVFGLLLAIIKCQLLIIACTFRTPQQEKKILKNLTWFIC